MCVLLRAKAIKNLFEYILRNVLVFLLENMILGIRGDDMFFILMLTKVAW